MAVVAYLVSGQLNPTLPCALEALGPTRLTNEAGVSVRLGEEVQPRSATLIAFWATWCMACRGEAAELASLCRRYSTSDLSILYLNVDDRPDAVATAAFLHASHADGLPVLYAGRAGWKAVTDSRIVALPRSYLFDRTGTASAVFSGFSKVDSVRELEQNLLEALRR